MKVELDEHGTLVITAESPVESFALSHWYNLWEKEDGMFLVQTVERSKDGGPLVNHNSEVLPRDRMDPEGGIPGRQL